MAVLQWTWRSLIMGNETERDVADKYVETPIGSLADRKFVKNTTQGDDYNRLPSTSVMD